MTDTVVTDPMRDPYAGPINLHRPHFVGIGGAAMSSLARLCLARGAWVSGSDKVVSPQLIKLRAAGCRVEVGHHSRNVHGASCVVYTASTADSEEVFAARVAGVPVVHRAQVLQAIAEDRRLIAVAGTHGKSTTTGMLATALMELGADPSFIIGAELECLGSGARHGGGEFFVAEAGESDRSYHFLTPEVAVVTTIAFDHQGNYDDLAAQVAAYTAFAERIRLGGLLVVNADNPASVEFTEAARAARPDVAVLTYGRDGAADLRICAMLRDGWVTTMRVGLPYGTTVEIVVPSPSAHHAHDAVAALTALVGLGFDPGEAATAVSRFDGVHRRFSRVGEAAGVTVVDCFSDHANEIAADIAAARCVAGDHKVLVVFQPPEMGRVAMFGRDIGAELARADAVVVLDAHGPAPVEGGTSAIVTAAIDAHGGKVIVPAFTGVPSTIATVAHPGDIVLTMGAGNVTGMGHEILRRLRPGVLTRA